MKLKRILSAALAALLLAGCASSFAGCGKKQVAEKQIVDHVYRATYLKKPEDISYIERLFVKDGSIYMYGTYYDRETYQSETRLFRMGMDGSNVTRVDMPGAEIGENSYVQQMLFAPDGALWQVVFSSHYDEETYEYTENTRIVHVSADGTVLADVDTKDVWGDASGEVDGEYIYHYINRAQLLGEDLVFLDSDRALYRMSGDGTVVGEIDVSELMNGGYINNMMVSGEELTLLYSDYSGNVTKMSMIGVDWETQKMLAPVELDTDTFANVWNYYAGEEYTFYYSTQEAVFGYDAATGASTKLMDFMNSDLSVTNVNELIILSQDQFIARGWDDLSGEEAIMMLNRVPDDQVVPKFILTLAVVGDDWNLREKVLRFNRQSEEYRVQIKKYELQEYSGEGEYDYQALMDQAVTALNNDIIAGRMPDILLVSPYMPLSNYISKGLLADLYAFIDNDPGIKREDFLPNVLQALEVNGKLYEIMPSFTVQTLLGKEEMLGGRTKWTMGEFLQWAKGIPEESVVFYDMTRDQMLELFCTLAYEEFVDADTGKCYFDTDDFKQVLEYVKALPTKSIWESQEEYDETFYQAYQNRFRTDAAMLEHAYIQSFESYVSMMNHTFFSEDITPIGLPSMNGNGSVITMDDLDFAISAKSPVIDGAWAFVSYFLTEEYQDSLTYTFPLRVSSLEKLADKVVEQQAEEKKNWEEWQQNQGDDGIIDDDMVVVPRVETSEETAAPAETEEAVESEEAVDTEISVDTSAPIIGGVIGMPNPYPQSEFRVFLDEEMADELIAFVKSLNHVQRYNVPVNNIIKEEAAQYFAGQKSLDETARVIQNRVSTYVAERR